MKRIIPALIIALGAILASQPLRGDIDVPKVDDASCPVATHVLLHRCTKAP